MTPPAAIVSAYPAAGPWNHVADAGGLSGAQIWRSPRWRLKAWPRGDVSADHLRQTHAWMRQAAHLDFVPQPLSASSGDSVITDGQWLWDVVAWMPGEPLQPTPARLAAAGRALAALHLVWQANDQQTGPCPVVRRRLDALSRVPPIDDSPARELIALVHRHRHRQAAIETLNSCPPLANLHPCLCDLRADHVLFADDRVTGLIDFGSARIDHPAADLARLLGDCLPGDVRAWQPLLDAYHSLRPLTPADHALIAVLERTEPVVALLTWIDRIRRRPLTAAERERLGALTRRIQSHDGERGA